MSANVEGAINGVLLAGLTALSPLLGLVTPVTAAITQPLQDVVNAINTLGPVGVILANPLQNVVNALDALTADPTAFQTFVIGLTGPLISGIGATGAAIQGVVDAIGGGDSQTIASAVIDAPAVVLGAVLNGQFGGQGFGPDLASLALPGFPPNPVCTTLCAGGILNPLELAGTAILTPGVIPTLQSLQNLIAGALKPPPIATAEAAPLQLTSAGATNAPSALPNLTATTMTLPTTQTSETNAADPTGGTGTNGSAAAKVTGTATTTPAADPTGGTGTNVSAAAEVTGTTTTTPAADPAGGTAANGSAAAKVTKTTATPAGDPTSGRGANGLTGGNTAGGNGTKETDRKPSATAAKTAAGHTGTSGDEAKHASHE
jgi:hypothetical protein